ncbi:MAG: YicC family protein [Thermoguttaceae bacterium]|nr:YicC family protein [Thermoguttaceae bacterium]
MLVSMTGFGSASTRDAGYLISSEIKTVNNRFYKASIKTPEGLSSLETKIDELLRRKIERGSVYFSLKLTRENAENDIKINFAALKRYVSEARRFIEENPEQDVEIGALVHYFRLPGVASDSSLESGDLSERMWEPIARNVEEALEKLSEMRLAEGAATERYLSKNLDELRESIGEIKALAPGVVENYRERLGERVAKALAENGAALDPNDLIREIAIYVDRVDISEEISRFYSHLEQFEAAVANRSACGKKLDFLTQEMFRETNTIGSKANSPDILKRVVEMKSTIERIREMVQNVE